MQTRTQQKPGDIGIRRRSGQKDAIEVSDDHDRIPMVNIEFEAGEEIVEPKDGNIKHNIAV